MHYIILSLVVRHIQKMTNKHTWYQGFLFTTRTDETVSVKNTISYIKININYDLNNFK